MATRALHPALAWVVVRDGSRVFTLRWRRGDQVAYVLVGARIGDYGLEAVATIAVPSTGWTDLQQVRVRGEAWLIERRSDPAPIRVGRRGHGEATAPVSSGPSVLTGGAPGCD
ncbi:MAG: hypothetical protein ACRDTC_18840 [Pseudonocardiaceae bacterium]